MSNRYLNSLPALSLETATGAQKEILETAQKQVGLHRARELVREYMLSPNP